MDPENCIRNGFAHGSGLEMRIENRHPAKENNPHTSQKKKKKKMQSRLYNC